MPVGPFNNVRAFNGATNSRRCEYEVLLRNSWRCRRNHLEDENAASNIADHAVNAQLCKLTIDAKDDEA